MTAPRVEFVLVRPARVANVASAARALANMDFSHLTLVDPPVEIDNGAERAAAYGAWDVLDHATRARSLADALKESTWVVGVSGRASSREMGPRELASRIASAAPASRVALVFGPERTGLSEDDLRLCHAHVRIPTGERHPSLNLAQAVMVIAYEVFMASRVERAEPITAPPPPGLTPTTGDIEALLEQWRAALDAVGYLTPQAPQRLLAELRRFVTRSRPTPREMTLLRGIARQITWAGRNVAPARARRR